MTFKLNIEHSIKFIKEVFYPELTCCCRSHNRRTPHRKFGSSHRKVFIFKLDKLKYSSRSYFLWFIFKLTYLRLKLHVPIVLRFFKENRRRTKTKVSSFIKNFLVKKTYKKLWMSQTLVSHFYIEWNVSDELTERNSLTPDPKILKLLFTRELKHNQQPLQFNPDYPDAAQ